MRHSQLPFNIDLFIPTNLEVMYPKVTSLDTYLPNSKNFHPEGLYSTEIFGVVGTPNRELNFGFIDIKIPVIHPIIYKTLIDTKTLYKEIISSSAFAVWDETISDFVRSNAIDGYTGYEFFIQHFSKIKLEEKPSMKREQSIRLLEMYANNCLIDKILVIPAGYRDIEVDRNGRESSDECNSLYYKLIAISNTIHMSTVKMSPESYNKQRVSIQNTFSEIYNYFYAIIDGKKNLMMGNWMSRKIFNSTRNVITSANTVITDIDDNNVFSTNDTAVGMLQFMKGTLPISIYNIRNGFLSQCLISNQVPALLTNPKTLMSERVTISNKEFERWLTNEGIEKVINYYREETVRHNPIKIDGYYLGLIYLGKDNTFKLIHGIDELPKDRNPSDCRPITYTELFYLSLYQISNTLPIIVSRYPISGIGSIYPSKVFLRTTIDYELRRPLNDDWEVETDDKLTASQFPKISSTFFNSMAPNTARLAGMGADIDGDMCTGTILYDDESIQEVDDFLMSKKCYVKSDGTFIYNTNTDTIKYVVKGMTG